MGWILGESAKRTGCSERTLRRYINGGLLRGRRVAGGQLELSHAEETYLRGHWTLLSKLMAALRTERDVRLAVLFGSTATGEDTPISDVDLLIVHRRSGVMAQVDLRMRLRSALGTPVDVVMLEQAEAQPPLLADVLREGRVLIDRDDLWGALQQRRDEILAAGAREDELIMTRAHAALAAASERLAKARHRRVLTGANTSSTLPAVISLA
ncbi:MAG TPA: nucleotidyltransferase domain-containing protein [Solirubrobacteraceae bacterium]|nr:nucleotidyltransferase domain-containing protein [Solirubrobacteraceae bacterium]